MESAFFCTLHFHTDLEGISGIELILLNCIQFSLILDKYLINEHTQVRGCK